MAGSGVEKPIVIGTLEDIDIVLLPDDDLEALRKAAAALGLGERDAYLPLAGVLAYARSGEREALEHMLAELRDMVWELYAAAARAGGEQADGLLEEAGRALSGVRLLQEALRLIDTRK